LNKRFSNESTKQNLGELNTVIVLIAVVPVKICS